MTLQLAVAVFRHPAGMTPVIADVMGVVPAAGARTVNFARERSE